jgi:hypothetical protein
MTLPEIEPVTFMLVAVPRGPNYILQTEEIPRWLKTVDSQNSEHVNDVSGYNLPPVPAWRDKIIIYITMSCDLD